MTAPEPYLAAALQLSAWNAEAAADAKAARAGILEGIARLDRELAGTRAFLETFYGLPLRLAVCPEYLFTGFPTGRVPDFVARAVFAPEGVEEAALAGVAARHGLYLAVNAYESDPAFPGLYFQACLVFGPAGDLVLRYRRVQSLYTATPHDVLADYLRVHGPDSLFPVADTAIGRLGCIASEEILYPEIARALALKGAEVLIHSSSEQGGLMATPKHVARQARAFESIAWLVSANTAGITGGGLAGASADGNSAIIDWKGIVQAESLSGENANAAAAIDIGASRKARARPGMANTLARQRLELFRDTYSGTVWPPDSRAGGANADARAILAGVIEARRAKGLI